MAIASKPKSRIGAQHKKRIGEHQKRSRRFNKTYWPYLPIAAIIALGMFVNTGLLRGGVLSYATSTSIAGLLDSTNDERHAHGVGQLSLSSQLNKAAQAKADDMAARNYWSHNTPDGKEPWFFIAGAGYGYQAAGENLAYGFATSQDTITGWMNSPSHRDNMLNNTYREVGFGMTNSANYQNSGNQTIVVALYANPSTNSVLPSSGSTQPPATENSTAADNKLPDVATPDQSGTGQNVTVSATVPASDEQRISRVQIATSGSAPWSILAASLLLAALLMAFLTKHSMAWHRALVKGEAFIIKHKGLDILIVCLIMVAFILTRTAGVIQ